MAEDRIRGVGQPRTVPVKEDPGDTKLFRTLYSPELKGPASIENDDHIILVASSMGQRRDVAHIGCKTLTAS